MLFVGALGSMQRRAAEALVQQALDAAARASKGFSLHLCAQARPHIGDLLAGPLQAAISIPQVCFCSFSPGSLELELGSESPTGISSKHPPP